jgi:hypothetical protein
VVGEDFCEVGGVVVDEVSKSSLADAVSTMFFSSGSCCSSMHPLKDTANNNPHTITNRAPAFALFTTLFPIYIISFYYPSFREVFREYNISHLITF